MDDMHSLFSSEVYFHALIMMMTMVVVMKVGLIVLTLMMMMMMVVVMKVGLIVMTDDDDGSCDEGGFDSVS